MDNEREKELIKLIHDLDHLAKGYAHLLYLKENDTERLKKEIAELENKLYKRNHHFNSQTKTKFLTMAKKVCAKCGIIENLQVDHIVSIKDGGTNEADNLQFLCYNCHKSKHKRRE